MTETKLPVLLGGTVTRYKGDGRKLGYPTANISTDTHLSDGVYFGHADMVGFKNHPAVIFIGTPTTMGDTVRRVEAHLLDIADKDYYGENIRISVEKYHRSNVTLDSVEDLLKLMKSDEAEAREWFNK